MDEFAGFSGDAREVEALTLDGGIPLFAEGLVEGGGVVGERGVGVGEICAAKLVLFLVAVVGEDEVGGGKVFARVFGDSGEEFGIFLGGGGG